jgi:hypothetical protein
LYPAPAGSVEVALPTGEGAVQATIPNLDFVADSSIMIQITPVLASGPGYGRAFYGTPASSTTFCLIPTGASGDGCGRGDPVDPAGTTLAFTSPSVGQHGDDATIAAQLLDEDGSAIGGAELDFELSGVDANNQSVTLNGSATTGEDGVASHTRTLTEDAGAYNLTVRYTGQAATYEPSTDETVFVIDREATITTLDVTGKGKNRTLTATLAEDDGAPLDRTLVFYATDAAGVRREIGRAGTQNGTVSFSAPPDYRGGQFDFEAVFDGEHNYAGSSAHDQT